ANLDLSLTLGGRRIGPDLRAALGIKYQQADGSPLVEGDDNAAVNHYRVGQERRRDGLLPQLIARLCVEGHDAPRWRVGVAAYVARGHKQAPIGIERGALNDAGLLFLPGNLAIFAAGGQDI